MNCETHSPTTRSRAHASQQDTYSHRNAPHPSKIVPGSWEARPAVPQGRQRVGTSQQSPILDDDGRLRRTRTVPGPHREYSSAVAPASQTTMSQTLPGTRGRSKHSSIPYPGPLLANPIPGNGIPHDHDSPDVWGGRILSESQPTLLTTQTHSPASLTSPLPDVEETPFYCPEPSHTQRRNRVHDVGADHVAGYGHHPPQPLASVPRPRQDPTASVGKPTVCCERETVLTHKPFECA